MVSPDQPLPSLLLNSINSMNFFVRLFSLLSCLEHVYIFYLEVFQWNTKKVNKIFALDSSFSKLPQAKVLASNQGAYNLILAMGIAYSLYLGNKEFTLFFNWAVLFAAVWGGVTVTPRIILVQGLLPILSLIAASF